MLVFISGGVRSGKSTLGEKLAADLATDRKIYLATATYADSEMVRRIGKHRKDRENKGFVTMEKSVHIDELQLLPTDTVLLDCLGTLTSNELFADIESELTDDFAARTTDLIFQSVMNVNSSVRNLIVISNEVFSDGITYDRATELYISVLGKLHVALVRAADRAVECACGFHVVHKGDAV